MNRDADRFAEATSKLRDVESHAEKQYLHEYDAILEETGESVRVITLTPDLADNEAAKNAFERVTGQWYNANTDPNIVSIAERETNPRPWIAVDRPHDLTLDRVQSRLTPVEIEIVVTDTAEALRTLGLYNAVHGALSPADILVYPDEDDTVVQVGGFGLKHAVRTALGEFRPTPYTAPELLDDPSQPTTQTDVYGLGAMTYFALTGQPPVAGDDLEQAIRDVAVNPPSEYNDEVGPVLDDAVMQALSTRPSDRQDSPHAYKRAFLSAFDADVFETGQDTDESESETDRSAGADDVDEDEGTPEETDHQATDDDGDRQDTSGEITRRATLLLGVGAVGGTGTFLLRDQLFGSENVDRSAGQPSPPATLTPTPTPTPTETPVSGTMQASFAAEDGDSWDLFGHSVAMTNDGTTALLGTYYDDDPNGAQAGSAYIFANTSGSWTQQAKLSADDGDSYDRFGASVALSSDGTTALIGATGDGGGSAYVFNSSGGSWTQQTKLTADSRNRDGEFGSSVAISSDGTTALLGDPRDYDVFEPGSVYVFDSTDGFWSQQIKLEADGDGNEFGGSVAVSSDGTTALIGAKRDEDPNGTKPGSAYVFDNAGGSWTQQAKLTPDDGDDEDRFGHSVAVSSDGTTALIGAYKDEDPNGEQGGSAYVFGNAGGSWTQQDKLAPDDGGADDRFGNSVAVSSNGTTALIGAQNNDGEGSAYVFDSSSGSWFQQTKLNQSSRSGADFGWAVSVTSDGSTALISNRRDGEGGSAYIYNL